MRVALTVSAVAVFVLGGVGGAVAAAPIGDAQGRALLARVHAAYLDSAGVQMSVISRGSRVASFGRFLVQLRGGVDVAEEFIGPASSGTEIVERRGGPTYVRDAAGKCWRPIAASDPRALVDVGLPYPNSRDPGKAMAPTKTTNGWRLPTENGERFWFLATQSSYRPIAKRFIVYKIDKAGRIIGLAIQALQNGTPDIHAARHPKLIWRTASLRAKTLTTAPTIPNPKPLCP